MALLPAGRKLTLKEFKEWVKGLDTNNDGVISREELKELPHALGLRFRRWRAWRAMRHADLNCNSVIDGDAELRELAIYAQKRWGLVVEGL
ncbi:hypothetical protein ACLOJK_013706 [Asimina triloba]